MAACPVPSAHACVLRALADVADAAMCNGKAKLVCIDCETEGVPSGAVASLSIQSDAAPQCLADWQMSLSSSQESARGQVTLVSALASLSQEYIVIVKNADGCYANRASKTRPALAEHWVRLEGAGEGVKAEPDEENASLLREASHLSGQGVRFVLYHNVTDLGGEGVLSSLGLGGIRVADQEADLCVDPPLLTEGVIELNGYATGCGEISDGRSIGMRLHLLLGHAARVHGYLYLAAGDACELSGADSATCSSLLDKRTRAQVEGTWTTRGGLRVVVTGDCAIKDDSGSEAVIFGGAVYSGSVAHGPQVSTIEGSVSGSSSNVGTFSWRLEGNGLRQRQEWQSAAALRTSAMSLLESHYKQRCELKLRGTRVKRRSLLQRMKNPRTFECFFQGIEADGADRKATVTVGAAADGFQGQGTGFFLYQRGRLIASCMHISLPRADGQNLDSQEQKDGPDTVYIGVVDMGAGQVCGQQYLLDKGPENVALEWMRDLEKWLKVEKELQRVLAEYSGRSVPPPSSTDQSANCMRLERQGADETGVAMPVGGSRQGGDSLSEETVAETTGACYQSSDEAMTESSGTNSGANASTLERGKWMDNGKGKIVDRSRCRIAGRGPNATRCPNPPMEGTGGLCAFHCKKQKHAEGSAASGMASPADASPSQTSRAKQEGLVESLAASRQPRRIIKSSMLEGYDSEGELTGLRGFGGGARVSKRIEDNADGWKEGDRAWIMDVAGVHCPIAMIASHDINEDNGQGAETENPEEGDAGLDDETSKEKIDLGQQIHSGCEANAAPEDAAVHDESTRVSVNEYVSSTNTADFDLPFQGDRLEPGGGPGALQNTDTVRVTELAHKNVAVTKVLLNAEIAAEIYAARPDADYKQHSIELSVRYGVAPKTIRDVWDRKTWCKATQHLVKGAAGESRAAIVAPKKLPAPSSEILLATLLSGRLKGVNRFKPGGTYRVKLDTHMEAVECYLANLNRLHPLTLEPADPAWVEAEAIRRQGSEEGASANTSATAATATGATAPRKRGRKSHVDSKNMAHGGSAGSRPQRNTLEGRCRTVVARLVRSETCSSLRELQEVMHEDERAGPDEQHNDWLVLNELQKVSERAGCMAYTTFVDFWEDILKIWRMMVSVYGRESPVYSLGQQVAEEFDLIFEDTFADDLARLRTLPGCHDEDGVVDGMDLFGLRVCVYKPMEHRLQYGMVDDAEDSSVHIMYDDEEEGWVELPSKLFMILRPHEEDCAPETFVDSVQGCEMIPTSSTASAGDGPITSAAIIPTKDSIHSTNANAADQALPVKASYSETRALDTNSAADRASNASIDNAVMTGTTPAMDVDMGGGQLKAHVKLPEHVFQLGIQVEVLYDDGTWYVGRITQYNQELDKHRIVFDDGDWQEISLPDPDVRLACIMSNGEPPSDLESRDKEASESAFKLGDIVWWQYRKGEWWPSRVTSLQQIKSTAMRRDLEEMGQPDDDSVLVHTFGDRTYAWVDLPPADLRGFGLHAELLSQRVSDRDNFERSVMEALFIWQRQSAPQRRLQNVRYISLEDGGVVKSNIVVEYLQPKLAVVENEDGRMHSPPTTEGLPPAPIRLRGRWGAEIKKRMAEAAAAAKDLGVQAAEEAAREAAAEAAAAMKAGRIARGGAFSGAGTVAEGSGADSTEVGKKRGKMVAEEDDELSVGGWRIAQAIEQEKIQKEAEAREQRLAAILSRMSNEELLVGLSILGVALSRDQVVAISKLIAAKLASMGFGTAPSASPADVSNRPIFGRDEQGGLQQKPGGDSEPASSPQLRRSQSPPPPPPPLASAGSGADTEHDDSDVRTPGIESGVVDVAEPQDHRYLGVMKLDSKWTADIIVDDARLHLGTFSNVQDAAMAYDVAARLYSGEDAVCNFVTPPARNRVHGDIILDWWCRANPRVDKATGAAARCIRDGAGGQAPDSPTVKMEMDTADSAGALCGKRQRDPAGAGLEHGGGQPQDIGTDCSKKARVFSYRLGGDARVDASEQQRTESEDVLEVEAEQVWGATEWLAFNKRLSRETIAAEMTEAALRRTRLRTGQVAEELKRRQSTYCDISRRWARDQQVRAWWQQKTETMLATFERIQAVQPKSQ